MSQRLKAGPEDAGTVYKVLTLAADICKTASRQTPNPSITNEFNSLALQHYSTTLTKMDILSVLEGMASNAEHVSSDEVTGEDVHRWSTLFGFSAVEAKDQIENYRADVFREGISNDLWADIAAEKEAAGWDREAYEYSLTHLRYIKSSAPRAASKGTFLVKMEGPLTLETICTSAQLSGMPPVSYGREDDGAEDTVFVTVDGPARDNIITWATANNSWFTPTIVKLAKANKALNAHNIGPALGIDATLPQHLPQDISHANVKPQQNESPVFYFFYGTLANPEILTHHLDLPVTEPPVLYPATVRGGAIKNWGKYRALTDDFSPTTKPVSGYAYLVQTQANEDALRFYETDKYDVVRCEITFVESQDVVWGLTFRFAGEEGELE